MFEQGRNNAVIDESLLKNIPTDNKTIPDAAKRDLLISLITLKYTQSNSVCYVKDGQAIGIGAGQQSRIHCTRLAGNKADVWYLIQCPKVMNLPFKEGIKRADRDNAIDVYISEYYDDVLRDGEWQKVFTEQPPAADAGGKEGMAGRYVLAFLSALTHFSRSGTISKELHKSGVEYVAQAGGSIRDDNVIETCNRYNIAMALTGLRLFHHYAKTDLRAAASQSKDSRRLEVKGELSENASCKLVSVAEIYHNCDRKEEISRCPETGAGISSFAFLYFL